MQSSTCMIDDETIHLFTHKGTVTWAGKSEPKCNLLNCHDYDLSFCQCQSCDTVFWASYKTLFYGDLIGPVDLAEGALIANDKVSAAVSDTVIAADSLIGDPVANVSVFAAVNSLGDHADSDATSAATLPVVSQPLGPQPNSDSSFIPNPPSSLLIHQVNDVSGAVAMADRWPRVFNALSDRAFLTSQQPDGLQIPRDWLDLIHGMPNLSDDFYYHLFSQQERCLEFILCSIARVVMTLITV